MYYLVNWRFNINITIMKFRNLLLLVFLGISFNNYSQETWAPIGAKWYYGNQVSPVVSPLEDYLLFEVTSDTIIQNKDCKIIEKRRFYNDSSIEFLGKEIFYSDSNKVYHLINNTFYVLYDFNKKVGESWTSRIPIEYDDLIYPGDSLREVTVDSIKQIIIDNDTLLSLYTSASFGKNTNSLDFYYKSPIIENIGAGYMFMAPWPIMDSDVPYLRCYQSNTINYTIKSPCDTFINIPQNINNLKQKLYKILVYPNPINDKIWIDIKMPGKLEIFEIKIFNQLGNCIFFTKAYTGLIETIDFQRYPKGLYNIIISNAKYLYT